MSAGRDYAVPHAHPYNGPKDEDVKEDIRHIEEVPSDNGVDSKNVSSSPDHYTIYPSRTPYTGRWGRFREFIREPPIPPGEHITRYPNRWSRYREILKEPAAEFLGTMILIMIGNGTTLQVNLSANTAVIASPKGDYLTSNLGWAAGVAIGVWISGGYSGGHLNPAVTLSFAVFRDFPWRKVPIYMFAQLLGALCGAGLMYANYIHPIDIVEGGRHIRTLTTASLFSTYAVPFVTNVSAWWDEFLGTFVLLMAVCAVTDRNNGPPPAGLVPLCLFFTVFAIGAAIGLETGWAINPARDLGPRILTSMVGYGSQVYSFRSQYWIWCPIMAPFCGGLVAVLVYDTFLFTGSESLLNRPDARARRAHAHALAAERAKPGVPGVEIV